METVSDIVANGSSRYRTHRLSSIVAISRGYDSSAVAALAKEAGATEAVTLSVHVNGSDDSGADIARVFGLNLREFAHPVGDTIHNLDHVELTKSQLDSAAEFIATAGMGDDYAFSNFEPALKNTIYFTGSLGDSIWAKDSEIPPHLPCRVPYGKSLTEFRLRVGFAHVPVPVIGALFPSPIVAISSRSEMKPYSIGGEYDRPIPRRIAEEAGLRRDQFGIRKNATNPKLNISSEMRAKAFDATIGRYEDPKNTFGTRI
jgi:hypothetical protein